MYICIQFIHIKIHRCFFQRNKNIVLKNDLYEGCYLYISGLGNSTCCQALFDISNRKYDIINHNLLLRTFYCDLCKIKSWTFSYFRGIIFHNFRRELSRQERSNELNSFHSDKAPPYIPVKTGITNLIVVVVRSRTNSEKVVQNQHEMIKQDRHVTYREILASSGFSMTSINKIW